MVELLGITLIILGGSAAVVALLITLTFLMPGRVNRARHALETTPGRSFLIGLVNAIFFGVLAAMLAQAGELPQLVGVLILLALLALAAIGLGGALLLLRRRIYPPDEETPLSTVQQTLRAAVLLVAAFLAPVAGWFILFPLALVAGLGASIIALFRRLETCPERSRRIGD